MLLLLLRLLAAAAAAAFAFRRDKGYKKIPRIYYRQSVVYMRRTAVLMCKTAGWMLASTQLPLDYGFGALARTQQDNGDEPLATERPRPSDVC